MTKSITPKTRPGKASTSSAFAITPPTDRPPARNSGKVRLRWPSRTEPAGDIHHSRKGTEVELLDAAGVLDRPWRVTYLATVKDRLLVRDSEGSFYLAAPDWAVTTTD